MPERRVLIVDDSEGVREGLALLLSDSYRVAIAADGREALARAETFRPDVVLLDLRLPGLDGEEVIHRLRAGGGRPYIVAFTAYGGTAVERQVRSIGADDFLNKPLSIELLRERLRQIFVHPGETGSAESSRGSNVSL